MALPLIRGMHALDQFLKLPGINTVIDIGSGNGRHSEIMRANGKTVTTVSLCPPADIIADYMDTNLGPVDGIWACHVLEHVPNVGLFLEKCFNDLVDDGVLAITVPPAPKKHHICGGHLSLWNEGLLLYRLILAGFDCRKAMVGRFGQNISVIVKKKAVKLPPLQFDSGDVDRLAEFFPVKVKEKFDGRLGTINWPECYARTPQRKLKKKRQRNR